MGGRRLRLNAFLGVLGDEIGRSLDGSLFGLLCVGIAGWLRALRTGVFFCPAQCSFLMVYSLGLFFEAEEKRLDFMGLR